MHLYEDGRDKPEEAHEEYLGRAELVTDYMYKGVVILRILNVQSSDSGLYHCAFQHDSFYSDTFIMLKMAGKFQAHGPDEALVAMLGGDAELPCFLMRHQSIKNMKISWTRSLPSQVVHLYEDGRDKPEETMEEYYGRTELVKNVMHKGIVVLRIFNVQPSDSGQYRCAFQHGSFYSDIVIELKVAALGSHPQFHVEVTKSSQLRLECKSEGWFPQPKVQWMDFEGGEIPAQSETHTQDKGGLFHVTTSLATPPVTRDYAAVPADHVEFYAESNSEGASANAPGPAILAYACVATTNPDQDGARTHAPGTAPASQEEHNTSPDQDGASADPPGTALGNAAIGEDTPKAIDADLDPKAACTYPPGTAPATQDHTTNPDQDGVSADLPGAALPNAAPKATNAEAVCTYPPGAARAEAHDTLSSSASKAFEKVRFFFKYDPKKKAELQGTTERFTGLSISPYLQKVSRELSCVNSQISCSSALSPGSTTPMQSSHPLENFSNFNKAIVSHLEPRGAVPAQ
ncbi:Butyrophilin-like protein 2 [Myotis brandtii]|uniref:Butyrophilin-like protein 2 n=1 Tax=Myotis brandtii TaxID=109478 RepID=S7QDL5_MYOBR|nr:Butyrophilin-like protein 2 [Myotis brandtii]